ncbi:MAG: glycosyltransferase family 2 protein [Methanobacterium sp.]
MDPKVAIIILNWNGWEDTTECLESLYQINYENYDVILVDNNSEDNSIEIIKNQCYNGIYNKSKEYKQVIKVEEYEEQDIESMDYKVKENEGKKLFLLKNSKNYGFAKGNNIGIKFALKVFKPEYILLLNNDTYVDENFLKELIKATEIRDHVGIYAPKILNANNPKKIDSTGHIFSWGRIVDRGNGKIDKNQYDNKINVIGAKGAACLYKREMLESIGLFKEEYETLYEDSELSWRAHNNSWNARFVPKSLVYHKISKSIKKVDSRISYYQKLSLNNITLTVSDYGTRNQKILYTFLLLKSMLISYFVILVGKSYSGKLNYLKAIKSLYS